MAGTTVEHSTENRLIIQYLSFDIIPVYSRSGIQIIKFQYFHVFQDVYEPCVGAGFGTGSFACFFDFFVRCGFAACAGGVGVGSLSRGE